MEASWAAGKLRHWDTTGLVALYAYVYHRMFKKYILLNLLIKTMPGIILLGLVLIMWSFNKRTLYIEMVFM